MTLVVAYVRIFWVYWWITIPALILLAFLIDPVNIAGSLFSFVCLPYLPMLFIFLRGS